MAILPCVILLGAGRPDSIPVVHVAAIEINHVHDDEGRPVLDQIILWELADGRHRVVDWRLNKTPQIAWRCHKSRGGWILLIWDDGQLVRIQAASYRETWTQYDPELADRERWSACQRRLIRPCPATAAPVAVAH